MEAKRVILDTDPGIDDALAILLALASPEVQVEAVTVTSGNCTTAQGVINALSVLELAGAAHVPVAAGVEIPLIRSPLTAPETHGETGLGYPVYHRPGRARPSNTQLTCSSSGLWLHPARSLWWPWPH
jgi:purine nucleosidase